MHHGRAWLAAPLLIAGLVVWAGGATLNLALEDRFDPNPRRMALGVEAAGVVLGVAISWSKHPASLR